MNKELNASAVALGKLSAKSRLGGLSKKQRAEKMKPVWEASAKMRRERLLDK